jgi:hypothetical protein
MVLLPFERYKRLIDNAKSKTNILNAVAELMEDNKVGTQPKLRLEAYAKERIQMLKDASDHNKEIAKFEAIIKRADYREIRVVRGKIIASSLNTREKAKLLLKIKNKRFRIKTD